jgi:hypothetical protein
MSDNKKCNCNNCDCCNGYARDAKNPNRYVNLESGKERNLNDKKLNWLIILFFLVWLWNYMYGQNSSITKTPASATVKQVNVR